VIEHEWPDHMARMWHGPGRASPSAAAASACRPGLDPGTVWPATIRRKPAVTCDYALSGFRRLAVHDDTMCPECAQPEYPLSMTLILGMSKPEGIYLSVDYRVTDHTGALIDDESIKSLTIHYPPLDNLGPKILLGFTGLAKLPDGTPTLSWIRQTLRGEVEVIDQSMAHLRRRLNRDIAPLRVPLIINLLVLETYRRLFGGFTNLRFVSPGRAVVMNHFEYVMNGLNDWFMFANGSGTRRALTDGHIARLRPHLGVVPREPMNHMNLLAAINRRVATKDRTVSPFCHVSFINSSDRFSPTSRSFTERGESVPFEMPVILAGLDLTEQTRIFARNSEAFFRGEPPVLPEMTKDQVNEAIKRRP
jgi:hypothetical protein